MVLTGIKKTPFTYRDICPKNVGMLKSSGVYKTTLLFYNIAEAKKSLRNEAENLDGLSLYGGQMLLII